MKFPQISIVVKIILIILFILSGAWISITVLQNIIALAVIPIIGIGLVWYLLKPIGKITQQALALQTGELKSPLEVYSGDELETLASCLNKIAQNLAESGKTTSQNESIISAERNKLNAIVSSIVEGIIALDPHQKVILANKAAETITGYKTQQMLGQNIDELITLQDKNGNKILSKDFCVVGRSKQTPEALINYADVVGFNNHKAYVQYTSAPVSSSADTEVSCIITLHDTTGEKELETMQLDFVSMASHELRTPLTSIIGYLQVLSDEDANKLDAELQGLVGKSLISAKQLLALVNNLLNVSKVERGAFSISITDVDWAKIVELIVNDSQIAATQRNISLTYKSSKEHIPKVKADQLRATEVLNNLLSNALMYTKPGGKVDVSIKVADKEVVTAVSDTGIGIPKDAIPHLFTKFFRVQGALDKDSSSKGTGLGLYISKSIIDLHRGKIWVESEPGKGSTFYFTLPRSG